MFNTSPFTGFGYTLNDKVVLFSSILGALWSERRHVHRLGREGRLQSPRRRGRRVPVLREAAGVHRSEGLHRVPRLLRGHRRVEQ